MREFRLRKVRPRIRELFRQAVELHDPQLREGYPRDLIDEFLEIHRRDPQFLPETDLISSVVAPYIQSLDPIAGTLGFALLHLLAEPRYAEMLQHEADRAFDAGLADASALRRNRPLSSRRQPRKDHLVPVAPSAPQVPHSDKASPARRSVKTPATRRREAARNAELLSSI